MKMDKRIAGKLLYLLPSWKPAHNNTLQITVAEQTFLPEM